MRLFYIEPSAITGHWVKLGGSEAHHIKNVLRLKINDRLRLVDGTGWEYKAVIKKMDAEKIEVEIRHKLRSGIWPGACIYVAQAFLKEKKMDTLVRQLSELGAAGWMPFFSQRSIPRPDQARLAGRIQRWQRIAAEALKQCRRKTMLEISVALSFDQVLEFSQTCDLKILFWENESAPFRRNKDSQAETTGNKIVLMLGPEGGFTDQEIAKARNCGFSVVGLGPRILRAETAAVVACTLTQYFYGDMGSAVEAGKSEQKILDKDSGVY